MRNEQNPILLAEDNEQDIVLIRRALDQLRVPNPLVITYDGYQAVDYLSGLPPYTDRIRYPLPCLLLLDVKMRLMNGLEVLAWLQSRPEFSHMPAVVLSDSSDGAQIAKARLLGAADYRVKPTEPADLTKTLQEIYANWVNPGFQLHRLEPKTEPEDLIPSI